VSKLLIKNQQTRLSVAETHSAPKNTCSAPFCFSAMLPHILLNRENN